jgi:hypothetical protein
VHVYIVHTLDVMLGVNGLYILNDLHYKTRIVLTVEENYISKKIKKNTQTEPTLIKRRTVQINQYSA